MLHELSGLNQCSRPEHLESVEWTTVHHHKDEGYLFKSSPERSA